MKNQLKLGNVTRISAFDGSKELPVQDIFALNVPLRIKADDLVFRVVTKDDKGRRVTFFLKRESK